VEVQGAMLRFSFRGKSGVDHSVALNDLRLARIVQRCQDLPGQEIFQYLDAFGKRKPILSDDVNDYLREVSGSDITAKDFRTWGGTMVAAVALRTMGRRPAGARRTATSCVRWTRWRSGWATRAQCAASIMCIPRCWMPINWVSLRRTLRRKSLSTRGARYRKPR